MFSLCRMELRWTTAAMVLLLLSGCASTYLSVWETLGFQRRDLLVARVENAREGADASVAAFERVLDDMMPIAMRDAPVADTRFAALDAAFRDAQDSARRLSSEIEQVETVSQGLFLEWESELAKSRDSDHKRNEQRELATSRQAYNTLIGQFRSAEVGFSPTLNTVRDSIRVLQRNRAEPRSQEDRNALLSLRGDVDRLASELRRAIAVANDFVRRFER